MKLAHSTKKSQNKRKKKPNYGKSHKPTQEELEDLFREKGELESL